MSNNGCRFGDPCPFIPTEPTIGTFHGQQSAGHCLSSKVRKEFSFRTAHCCAPSASADSVHLFGSFWIKVIFNGRFQGQAGPPQVEASRHWRKIEMRHSRDGLGLWLPGSPFWRLLVIATIWWSINSSGKIKKHVKEERLFLKHSLCFPEPVAWQVLAASSVFRSAYSRPLRAPLGLFGAPGFTSDEDKNNANEVTIQSHMAGKKTTTPFNFTIKSRYRFK